MKQIENKKRVARTGLVYDVGEFISIWLARHAGARLSRLPALYLDVTNECNSRCRGCDIWKPRQEDQAILTTEEIIALVPALRRLGTRLVSIGGGEPTTRADLETCVAAFRDAGVKVHVNSNGLNVDRERAVSLVDAGLCIIYVSMDHYLPDGYKAIRGVDGLESVIATIGHFRSIPRPIPVGVNVTVSRLNQDALEEIADACVALDVQKVQFTPIHSHLQHQNMDKSVFDSLFPTDIDAIKATLKRVTRKLRKLGLETNSDFFINHFENAYKPVRSVPCVAGFPYVIIDPFGEVMPCYQRRGGLNVKDSPLDEILASETFDKQRKQVTRCDVACLDVGSAEPSIRFHLPYILSHPLEIYRQAQRYL